MVHRFFFRRFVFMILAAALLFGGARALFGAGYRQGFVQGSMMAAGDGQAVTVAPEAAFRAMTHWGLGPLGAMFCGLPLALLGLGGLAFIFATGARRPSPFGRGMGRGPRHGPPGWKHAHGPGRRPTDDIGPEKQPNDFV
jgi:hypothetical protein